MLTIRHRADATAVPHRTLTLPFDRRQKSRLRARLDPVAGEVDGPEVAIELERGTSLSDGNLLRTEDDQVVLVRAQPESVSVARTSDRVVLARAAYHLGNRHVPIQILVDELRYQHDHVLDDMVSRLGIAVEYAVLPFEPESGAYGSGHSHLSHGHGHSHGQGAHIHWHGHEHAHDEHEHPHGHAHDEPAHDEHAHDEPAHDEQAHDSGVGEGGGARRESGTPASRTPASRTPASRFKRP